MVPRSGVAMLLLIATPELIELGGWQLDGLVPPIRWWMGSPTVRWSILYWG